MTQLVTQFTNDYLRIYNGPTATSTTLFDGISTSFLPVNPNCISTTNQVYLKFVSNGSTNYAGYTINYQCTNINTDPTGTLYESGGAGNNYSNYENGML